MLPPGNRLNLKKTQKSKLDGRRIASHQFALIAKKKKNIFKLAVVVSKKIAARSVDRNRIRRLITESLREQKIFEGELIVVAKKNIADLKMNVVQKHLLTLIKKI